MRRLRIGIAGLGSASRHIIPQMRHVPEVELVAGADIRSSAADEFKNKHGCNTYSSVAAMCESGKVDAVWIATPNVFHAEHTVTAADCGVHVIVEKPMAVTLEDADRMIAAAERNGVKLLQGHSKIYGPALQKIREVVCSGRLGRVIQVNSWVSNDWLQRPRLAAEVNTQSGGGVCLRQGPHQVDIVRYLGGGLVKSIRAIAGRADQNFDTEGDYTAFLEFADGTPATMAFNGYGYFDAAELTWGIGESNTRKYDVNGYSRRSRLTGPIGADAKYFKPGTTEEIVVHEPQGQAFFGLTIVGCERGVIRQSPHGIFVYTDAGREEIRCADDPGHAIPELRELYHAVTKNRQTFLDGRWGKATLEVCLAMLQSSNERREVTLANQIACTEVQDTGAYYGLN